MRIIAGRYRSRRLKMSPPPGTRPTSDKLRETLFNILGARVIESRFLDGYAGVGAVGIEALSRGAAAVVFVEESAPACAAIEANVQELEIREGYRIIRTDLAKAVRGRLEEKFDIAFLDPPYDRRDLYGRDLQLLGAGSFLTSDGILVVEHDRPVELPARAGRLHRVRTHPQGDSALTFYEQGVG